MPLTLKDCAEALQQAGLRHHVDAEEQFIRLVLVTRRYRNRRGEHLAIVTIGVQDDGHRLRLSIERAFDAGLDPAGACLLACRCAAATPLVAAEYDADFDNLRLVIELVVGKQGGDSATLASLVEQLVSAAEVWQLAFDAQRQADDADGMHGQAA
jgi:hypothetical protein